MKGFFLVLVGLAWLILLYYGWIHFIGKTYKNTPAVDSSISAQQKHYLQQQSESVKDKQRQLMLDRQQRLRDMQQR